MISNPKRQLFNLILNFLAIQHGKTKYFYKHQPSDCANLSLKKKKKKKKTNFVTRLIQIVFAIYLTGGGGRNPLYKLEKNNLSIHTKKSIKIPCMRTIRKKPNERSKAERRPSPDDSMTGQRELGTTSRTVGPELCRRSTFKPLVISTYNVRTLHQQGKTHQLFMGCSDVGIDIIGIQKHRLITKEPTEELWSDDKNWVLVYSSATDQRQGGVGLLMSKHIYKCLQSVTPVTKRMISATFHGNPQLTVTSVYAPTECSLPDDKDDFCNDLNNHLEQMKPHNIHLVVGDFNARVGQDSHSIHSEVIGRHCFYDTTNNNGERASGLV